MKNNKNTKVLYRFLFFFQISFLLFSPLYAHALTGIFGNAKRLSPSGAFKEFEKRYNFNPEEIRKVGQGFNVSDYKKGSPSVQVTFFPQNPRPGEEVTARAVPLNFSNEPGSLYFTWALKHATNNRDYNEDGKITIEDYKIEAHRLIANDAFSVAKADYSTDRDNDGYKARLGGDDKYDVNDYCYVHDFRDGTDHELVSGGNQTNFNCPAGTTPACVEDEDILCSTSDTTIEGYQICTDLDFAPTCSPTNSTPTCNDVGVPRCISTLTSPSCSLSAADLSVLTCDDVATTLPSCTVTSQTEKNSLCTPDIHLFPDAPGYTTGDGSFTAGEERFWQTNPQDPSTSSAGIKDEAVVAGLSIDEFSWTYEEGDEVTVAVEGSSTIPTKHDDTSYQIMWAFPENTCPVINTGEYVENVKKFDVTFLTAKMDAEDLSACMLRNFLSPTEGDQPGNLDISLSYLPETPQNDSSGNDLGDIVTVQSSIENTGVDSRLLHYEWSVERSIDGSAIPSAWKDITNEIEGISTLKGNGLSSLRFPLNLPRDYFPDDRGFLRVRVETSRSFAQGQTEDGRGSVVIPVSADPRHITVHTITVSSDGTLSLGEPICSSTLLEHSLCRVVKDEIIGLSVDNSDNALRDFFWSINDQTLSCANTISPSCANGDVTFFPVFGAVGDNLSVSLTAVNVISGKTLERSRLLQIVDPSVDIVSPDGSATPKKLGSYIDLDGQEFEDLSTKVFQATTGSTVTLSGEFHPAFLGQYAQKEWTINGTPMGQGDTLSFDAGDVVGTISQIGLTTQYLYPQEFRRALNEHFGISQFTSTGAFFGNTIQIETVSGDEVSSDAQAVIGTIATNTPGYLLFLLRIFLTSALILFVTGLVFRATPHARGEE